MVGFVLGVGRGRGGSRARHGWRGTAGAGRNMTSASWSLGLLVDVWRARARGGSAVSFGGPFVLVPSGWAEAARWKWMSVASFVRTYDI